MQNNRQFLIAVNIGACLKKNVMKIWCILKFTRTSLNDIGEIMLTIRGHSKVKTISRGVSDVGFSIFADTDADFAF